MASPFRYLLGASLAVTALIAGDAPAAACINETSYDQNPAVQHVARAEQALSAGKPASAVELSMKSFPKIRSNERLIEYAPAQGIDPLGSRAQRVVAVALVRTEGLLAIGSDFPSASAEERRGNLAWATGILRAYLRLKNTPRSRPISARPSKLPETREEALTILDGLARKDLMTSAQGYAALAELRLAAGDRAGHDAAMKRADAMRKVPGRAVDPVPASAGRGVARG